jgi:hypothetical protein
MHGMLWDGVAIMLIAPAVLVWLFGRACRYVLAGRQSPHDTQRVITVVGFFLHNELPRRPAERNLLVLPVLSDTRTPMPLLDPYVADLAPSDPAQKATGVSSRPHHACH